jgi:hypothetical protein
VNERPFRAGRKVKDRSFSSALSVEEAPFRAEHKVEERPFRAALTAHNERALAPADFYSKLK